MSQRIRLDVYLVNKGLASSRTQAQSLIEAGQVFSTPAEGGERKVLRKCNFPVSDDCHIQVESGPVNQYVSRGGLKLEGALLHTQLNVENQSVLDIGISTGGFSDCLLQRGAAFILGVDVGHGQVHPKLLIDSRLKVIEGVNARALSKEAQVLSATPPGQFDLIVMDVSFISVSLIIPELRAFLRPGGKLLSLIKPQFEVGVDGLSKGGIVTKTSLYGEVETKVRSLCATHGLRVFDYFGSSIQGKDGNNEFFVFAEKVELRLGLPSSCELSEPADP